MERLNTRSLQGKDDGAPSLRQSLGESLEAQTSSSQPMAPGGLYTAVSVWSKEINIQS